MNNCKNRNISESQLNQACKNLFNWLNSDFRDLEKWADDHNVILPESCSKDGKAFQVFGYLVRYDGHWQIINLYKSLAGGNLKRLDYGGSFR